MQAQAAEEKASNISANMTDLQSACFLCRKITESFVPQPHQQCLPGGGKGENIFCTDQLTDPTDPQPLDSRQE